MQWDPEARELKDSGCYGEEAQAGMAERWERGVRAVHLTLATEIAQIEASRCPTIDGEDLAAAPMGVDPHTLGLLEALHLELEQPWRAALRQALHWAALLRVQEEVYRRKVSRKGPHPRVTERNLRIGLLGQPLPTAAQVVIAAIGMPDAKLEPLVEAMLPHVRPYSDPTRAGGRAGGISVETAVDLIARGLDQPETMKREIRARVEQRSKKSRATPHKAQKPRRPPGRQQ